MRVISQDGRIDVPYEKADIACLRFFEKCVIVATLFNEDSVQLAVFSSEEKALKAMELLREQYENLEVFKVLSCGTTEYMERILTEEELPKIIKAYYKLNVFQFPQDSEVEV